MNWLDRLDRRYRHLCVPRAHQFLLLGQIFSFIGMHADPLLIEKFRLVPAVATGGEWWRFFTFLILPPSTDLLWFIFHCLAFNFIGTTLEQVWGVFKFNIYLLMGYLATIAAGLCFPLRPVSNWFLDESTFVAFAVLFPDVKFLVYYIIPVKAKWLALVTWFFLGLQFYAGDLGAKASVFATVANFFAFFGGTLFDRLRGTVKHAQRQAQAAAIEMQVRHECEVCGVTDKTDPRMEFRYCSKCAGNHCYCSIHLQDHVHVKDA